VAFGIWRKKGASVGLNGRLRRSPDVLATSQGDEMTLYDRRGQQYYTLNNVGASIWALLAAGTTRLEIVDAIRREYNMPAGRLDDPVEGDVDGILRELDAAGLVVAEPRAVQGHW